MVNMQVGVMRDYIKLQPRGVFTVPKKLRADLFDENNLAKITRVGRKLVIEPVTTLDYVVRNYTDAEVEEFFAEDAKETKKLRAKGVI
jgi:hypothetical protein